MEQKASKTVIEFIFVGGILGNLLLSMEPAIKNGLYPQWEPIGEN